MLDLLVEFLGSAVFMAVIVNSSGDAVAVGVALAAMVMFGGAISGGHFNPAVSLLMFMKGNINQTKLFSYVAVQLLASFAVLHFLKAAKGRK